MDITFPVTADFTGALLVVFATQGPELTLDAQQVDAASGGALSRALQVSRFKGETAEVLELEAPLTSQADRMLLVGLGTRGKAEALELERIGAALITRAQAGRQARAVVKLTDAAAMALPLAAAVAHLAHGMALKSYRFDKYFTKEPAAKASALQAVALVTLDGGAARVAHDPLAAVARGVAFARDLVSEPGNIIYPESFVERCEVLRELGVKVSALDEDQMRTLGFGALLGVAQGSDRPGRVLVLEYEGEGAPDGPPVALIGKGVTFDTGGISLKQPAGMEEMKWDMGGAAAVAGAMMAIAGRKAKARVVGLCALAENMPSGGAQRPGDVVVSHSGQTIEVINTDAEGRLVLCDVMWYAQNIFKPKVMVDLATLTGAMIITLGHEFGGLFSNSDTLAEQLVRAGFATGDKLWRLPMGEAYDKLIQSNIADMKNVGPREAGSISAAQFLKRFVQEGVSWAHLDIAGMAWASKDGGLWSKGATGYGVRLLDRFIADTAEA